MTRPRPTGGRVGRAALRGAGGWTITGDVPAPGTPAVYVGAPHTTWLDFPLLLALQSAVGLDLHWLGKAELFRGPAGPLMRRLGGIPVDRSNPAGLVTTLTQGIAAGRIRGLAIAAEGTRRQGARWKSGFYRIARDTGLPIIPVAVDGPTHTITFGAPVHVSGDVRRDMDALRAFYAGHRGIVAREPSVPRLREEDAPPPSDPANPAG